MIAAASDELGGFGILLLGLLILVVAVIWILFPIMVWIKLNELMEAQRAIHRALLAANTVRDRSEEHTSELQSQSNLVCRLLLEKKNYNLKESYHDEHIQPLHAH